MNRATLLLAAVGVSVSAMALADKPTRPRRLELKQPATMQMFREYCSRLTPSQLTNGDCVALAEGFSKAVTSAVRSGANTDVDASKIRIGLMAAPPEPRMYYPSCMLRPDSRFVSQTRTGEHVSWIWHAFAIVDGVVYDPMYKRGVDTIDRYCRTLWPTYADAKGGSASNAPWVYCVVPEDLAKIQGRSYSGVPRMMSFKEITLPQLMKNAQHLSQPR
jgi:hypothetical protein